MFLFEKIDKNMQFNFCFSEIPRNLVCFGVRQVTFLSENWKKLSIWSSVLFTVSALEMPERKHIENRRNQTCSSCLKGKHIENRRDQTCSSFSERYPLYSMTDLCRFHCRLSHDYLKYLSLSNKPIISVAN